MLSAPFLETALYNSPPGPTSPFKFATGVSGQAELTESPRVDGTKYTRGKARTLHSLYVINPEELEGCYEPLMIVTPMWACEDTKLRS